MSNLPKSEVTITERKEGEEPSQKLPADVPELFSEWWVKSGLRMPREFYIEECQTPGEYIDSQKADTLTDGYWSAEAVIKAVMPLLEEKARLRALLEKTEKRIGEIVEEKEERDYTGKNCSFCGGPMFTEGSVEECERCGFNECVECGGSGLDPDKPNGLCRGCKS